MTLQIRWEGDQGWLAWIRNLTRNIPETVGVQGVGAAGVRVQALMRRNLEAMIYSQNPAASGYIRTRTLFRSTHASPTGETSAHAGDEGAAHGGQDLASDRPEQVARVEDGKAVSYIGSWVSYAQPVVDGANQPSERPFVDEAFDEAEAALAEEMEKALSKALGGS